MFRIHFPPLFAWFLMLFSAAAVGEDRKPNFIVILADDLGYSDVGFNGSTFHKTPHLDQLAAESVRFDHGYSAGPVCSPTRASLLTGQTTARTRFTAIHYPPNHGRPVGTGNPAEAPAYLRMIEPWTVTELPKDAVTLPEVLQSRGYATGMFGKWHLGAFSNPKHPDCDPRDHGFDVAMGWGSAGSSYNPPWHVKGLEARSADDYLTDALTDAAIGFIEARKDQPFFVYLPHFAVHSPWMAVAEDVANFEAESDPSSPQHNAVYAAMIKRLDDSVGKIRATLTRLRLAENTVVVFTSDNGPVTEVTRGKNDADSKLDGFKHGRKITTAAPFRGEKGTLLEGGIRVPTLVHLPGAKANGKTLATPVITYDLFPTILDIAGIPAPEGVPLDGISLVPALQGNPLAERALIWHYPHYVGAPPSVKYPEGMKQRSASAIRRGPWKLTYSYENRDCSLFNIETDPGENRDVSQLRPDTTARLKQELLEYLTEVDAQFPADNPHNAIQSHIPADPAHKP